MLSHSDTDCQIPCLQAIAVENAEMPRQSPVQRLKFFIRRRMTPSQERKFKTKSNTLINRLLSVFGRPTKPTAPPVVSAHLEAGDLVRVKSEEEIAATLNHWRQLKGCTFMPEMVRFCGTTHPVLKPLRRFVDERDLRTKKCTGIVLLEGAICQGTAAFGPCDRCCFLFWREEWLEKIA